MVDWRAGNTEPQRPGSSGRLLTQFFRTSTLARGPRKNRTAETKRAQRSPLRLQEKNNRSSLTRGMKTNSKHNEKGKSMRLLPQLFKAKASNEQPSSYLCSDKSAEPAASVSSLSRRFIPLSSSRQRLLSSLISVVSLLLSRQRIPFSISFSFKAAKPAASPISLTSVVSLLSSRQRLFAEAHP